MCNVLEILRTFDKLRTGGAQDERVLTAKEKAIHTQGLVGVLKELHDELDAAVLQAFGLEPGLSTDALLTHLVALNAQRALEEKAGRIRWLRAEFQNPSTQAAKASLLNQEQTGRNLPELQADLPLNFPIQAVSKAFSTAQAWPGTLPEQVRAVAQALASANAALPLSAIEACFKG